ncbi:MAG: hypothetical protein HQL67_07305 [Magnetococcales bacterium]|nr:hypothetical protein [Magnetococcales bacterium]
MVNRTIPTAPDTSESTNLWWRRVSSVYLARVVRCQRMGTFIPTMHVGLDTKMFAHLDVEARMGPSGMVREGKPRQRMNVLEVLNKKLNETLLSIIPTLSKKTPVQLDKDGQGVTFWLEQPDLQVSDILELHFSSPTIASWPFHCFGRVTEMQLDPGSQLTRVFCIFESIGRGVVELQREQRSIPAFAVPPQPLEPERPVVAALKRASLSKPARESEPVAPVAAERVVEQKSKRAPLGTLPINLTRKVPPKMATHSSQKPTPSITPRPVKQEMKTPSVSPTPLSKRIEKMPDSKSPPLQHLEKKYDEILKKGMEVIDSKVTVTEKPVRISDDRKDFRINDRIPFIWSVVREETFQNESLPHFEKYHEFGLRQRIINQQILLKSFTPYFDRLKKKRSASRKYLIWLQDHFSWLFLRAASENEEEYFQGLTALLLEITKKAVLPLGRSERLLAQVVLQLKGQLEKQKERDLANSITEQGRIELAKVALSSLHRQTEKVVAALAKEQPALAEDLLLLKGLVDDIDLSMLDKPVSTSLDGKDLFTVNLSATGFAFRTRRLWIKQGDLLEMRIFLSAEGKNFKAVNCFGKVVFVQGPKDGKIKVATHIDPMPESFKAIITAHIARRQREILAEKAQLKSEYDD